MELKDLEGKHKLDAVDFSIESAKKWDEYYFEEDCQACRSEDRCPVCGGS